MGEEPPTVSREGFCTDPDCGPGVRHDDGNEPPILTVELEKVELDLLQGVMANEIAYLLMKDADDEHVTTLLDLYVRVGNKLGMNL